MRIVRSVLFFASLLAWASLSAQDWEVLVVTGTVDGAGTDARVFLTLRGSSGASPEVDLTALKTASEQAGLFENGSWDAFLIPRARVGSIGKITGATIRHDNSGNRPGWWLGAIMVRDPVSGERTVFIPNRWLAKDESDKQIALTMSPSAYGYRSFSPAYSSKNAWGNDTPGVASARARANAATGGISLYADAWAGGGAAQAAVGPSFDMAAGQPLFVRAHILYTGGLVNAFVASFSELRFSLSCNGSERFFDLSPAFTGPIVLQKVLAIGLMAGGAAAGASGAASAVEAVETVSLVNDATSLGSAMYQLSQSANARSESRTAAFTSRSGTNSILAGLRINVSAMLTGSSFGIVGGQVERIEVIGCPPPPTPTPTPAPTAAAERSIVLDCSSSMEFPKYGRCWGWHQAHSWDLGAATTLKSLSGSVTPGPSERKGQAITLKVQTSVDGSSWTDRASFTALIGQANAFGPYLPGVSARFIRVWAGSSGYIDASRLEAKVSP